MEKTLISWNVPNFVSINLMAAAGFLLLSVLVQFIARRKSPSAATNGGQYTAIVADADAGY